MAYDYTQWCVPADVTARLARSGIALRSLGDAEADADYVQSEIDAVQDEIRRITFRQFVADTVEQTRLYDGSGTAEQDVDELVSFTAATVLGIQANPGYQLANVLLAQEFNRPRTRLILNQGSLPGYADSALPIPYPRYFPTGRQNIQVQGKFGFAATIPVDLWRAHFGEVCARLAAEALFNPGTQHGTDATAIYGGRMVAFKNDTVEQKYEFVQAGDGTLWTRQFLQVVPRYRRDTSRALRNIRPPMI